MGIIIFFGIGLLAVGIGGTLVFVTLRHWNHVEKQGANSLSIQQKNIVNEGTQG